MDMHEDKCRHCSYNKSQESISLAQAEVGNSYRIERVLGSGPVRRRIMDMGLTKHVTLYVRKVAPLGDPMQVSLRGYELTLRRADTSEILVVPI
ncbi:MAG: FeoA domain-containing protein [Coriobacteriia bacterium]|nr:FeoA domain-containing protein [Coriobacteriia bacterium]